MTGKNREIARQRLCRGDGPVGRRAPSRRNVEGSFANWVRG